MIIEVLDRLIELKAEIALALGILAKTVIQSRNKKNR